MKRRRRASQQRKRQAWPVDRDRAGSRWAWKSIPLSEVTEYRWPVATQAMPDPPGSHAPATARSTALVESLRQLDSVVHDFLSCLGRADASASATGSVSAEVARFQRILASAPAAGGPRLGPPVLCGISPEIGLESLFGFLGSMRKTGVLRIESAGTTFMISIVQGDVVHAVSEPRPEAELLGNLLVERGALGATELIQFFERCGPSAGHLGEALNRQELVSTEALREALEVQLQLLFDRLLATTTADWCFHEGEATLSYVNLRMNATSVLLQSARKRDEGSAR